MKLRNPKSQRGFTLLELMISAVIGLVLMVAMTSLFEQGTNAVFTVTQRAETQQNMRTAIELMTKDISMAGAGLPTGGLQLANGAGNSNIACPQSGPCYVPGYVYPNGNYLTGIIPGFNKGVENNASITSAPGAINDSLTTIYCDYNFSLNNFAFSFPTAGSTTASVSVKNAATIPNNIISPGGLNVGDLLLFQVQNAGAGTASANGQGTSIATTGTAVAEITGLPAVGTGGPWVVTFASPDPLNFNQGGANSLASAIATANTDIATLPGSTTINVCRLYAVSYFIEVPAAGGTVQTPRLMRQVNGLTAVPVADNIINLQFSYDVINSSTSLDANQPNPIAAGDNLALVQKVNIWVMGRSLSTGNNRAQSMYLATSVSAGNMSFCNSYSDSTTVCQ